MDIPDENCPSPLQLKTFGSNRLCEKSSEKSCVSITMSAGGQSYTKVRGKVTGYAFNSPDGFKTSGTSIDDLYVDGVSITHGSPREHVWTYAAAGSSNHRCPQNTDDESYRQPSFVDSNYLCVRPADFIGENVNTKDFYDVPLWTTLGNCAGDCPDDLTFCVTLTQATSDDLELRICTDESKANEDIYIKSFDFYVQ